MIVFCPGFTNNKPKVKKKLFLKANSNSVSSSSPMSSKSSIFSSELTDVAVSMNRLTCNSAGKSVHRSGGRKTTWDGNIKGVMKGSRGGCSAEKGRQGKGGWDGEKDESGGGWEKGKSGWAKGKSKGGWKGGKVQKKKSSLLDGFNDDMSPDFVPYKRRPYTKPYNKVTSVYTQPDQKLRGTTHKLIVKAYTCKQTHSASVLTFQTYCLFFVLAEETINNIMDKKLDIEGECLVVC